MSENTGTAERKTVDALKTELLDKLNTLNLPFVRTYHRTFDPELFTSEAARLMPRIRDRLKDPSDGIHEGRVELSTVITKARFGLDPSVDSWEEPGLGKIIIRSPVLFISHDTEGKTMELQADIEDYSESSKKVELEINLKLPENGEAQVVLYTDRGKPSRFKRERPATPTDLSQFNDLFDKKCSYIPEPSIPEPVRR